MSINSKDKSKTLIIIDWDDTLFPTTWIGDNKINVTTKLLTSRLQNFFSKLDLLLYKLLQNMSMCGTVIIVTNAADKWVSISSRTLPLTRKLLYSNIRVVSARDKYKQLYPDDMYMWKRLVYKDIINEYLTKNVRINHVISIGDAEYEYRALVDLNKMYAFTKNSHTHILKAVKLIRYPTLELLLDQLIILNKSTPMICNSRRHMDLKFTPIK